MKKYFIRFNYGQNMYSDSGFDNQEDCDTAFEQISRLKSTDLITLRGNPPVIINLANVLTIEKYQG